MKGGEEGRCTSGRGYGTKSKLKIKWNTEKRSNELPGRKEKKSNGISVKKKEGEAE